MKESRQPTIHENKKGAIGLWMDPTARLNIKHFGEFDISRRNWMDDFWNFIQEYWLKEIKKEKGYILNSLVKCETDITLDMDGSFHSFIAGYASEAAPAGTPFNIELPRLTGPSRYIDNSNPALDNDNDNMYNTYTPEVNSGYGSYTTYMYRFAVKPSSAESPWSYIATGDLLELIVEGVDGLNIVYSERQSQIQTGRRIGDILKVTYKEDVTAKQPFHFCYLAKGSKIEDDPTGESRWGGGAGGPGQPQLGGIFMQFLQMYISSYLLRMILTMEFSYMVMI